MFPKLMMAESNAHISSSVSVSMKLTNAIVVSKRRLECVMRYASAAKPVINVAIVRPPACSNTCPV